jgi:hypothetical protein
MNCGGAETVQILPFFPVFLFTSKLHIRTEKIKASDVLVVIITTPLSLLHMNNY